MVECPMCSRELQELDTPMEKQGVVYTHRCVCFNGSSLFPQDTYDRQKKWGEIRKLSFEELLSRIKNKRLTEWFKKENG